MRIEQHYFVEFIARGVFRKPAHYTLRFESPFEWAGAFILNGAGYVTYAQFVGNGIEEDIESLRAENKLR